MLRVRDLGHAFGADDVLDGVTFDLNAGERLVVLDPSGCGKTTLLSLIAGILPVQRGTVTLSGKPPAPGRGSAVIFQTPRLLPWRRAAGNVAIALGHLPRAERVAAVAGLLEQVGLGQAGDMWPATMSGGMQQRLALARALALKAPLLLLDEPFANLDPLAREGLQDLLVDQVGSAFILVTHSVEEALVLGDRILLMQSGPGRIGAVLTPALSGKGGARRRDPAFWPMLAEVSDRLREAARE